MFELNKMYISIVVLVICIIFSTSTQINTYNAADDLDTKSPQKVFQILNIIILSGILLVFMAILANRVLSN